jgi:hypothetical protein
LTMVDEGAALLVEKIREIKVTTDTDLLNELRKTQDITLEQLNNILLRLEIRGLVSVSWMDKDRRRIEYREPRAEPARQENT